MTSKSVRDAQELKTVTLEWDAKFKRIAKLPTAVEQALAYKTLGLSPVPLRPGDKKPTCKAHPALSVIQLSDDDIERLFHGRSASVGMVGGYGGFFSVDNDEEDPAKCNEIERLQCELLSVPYARWKGRKGYKALYQDSRWKEPPTDLKKEARAYLECGLDLSEAERNREPSPKLEKEFTELKAAFNEKLEAFAQSNRLVPAVGKPIEIKSFRLITVLPPSLHPETGKAYQITPLASGHHATGLNGDGEAFAITSEDVNRFLDKLRPDNAKGDKGIRKGGGGKVAYVDYTRRSYSEAWSPIALADVLKHKPDLAEFSDAEYVEDRSPAIPSLLGKLVQGMMQVRKCNADKLGGFADVAKQLAALADEFIGRFPDQTKAVAGSIEDHVKPWQEKLGYEAGRALESAMATDFNFYIPGREPRAGETPTIYIRAGEQHIQVRLAMEHLVVAGVPFFQRGSRLVRPIMEEAKDALGRVTKTAAFAEVDVAYMRHALADHIEWVKFDKRSDEWLPCNASEDVARTLLSLRGDWLFRPVTGILSAPTLRPDGSLLDKTGYDEVTGLYLLNSIELPTMPTKPTKADAEAALKRIQKFYVEFPFVDDASESVAISALLTTVCRGVADVVPAHGSRAPVYGSGKSYLFDIASAAVNGCRCPVLSMGRDETEMEKRLAAKAIAGGSIICLDNVNGELGGDALSQLIERPICELRPLGKSEIVSITNRAAIFYNGNNVRPRGDMIRRTVLADLDPGEANPSERKFKHDPVAMVLKDRGQCIADCLTIVRAYIGAGKPKVVETSMNSFGAWSDSIRSAIVWCGMDDPCKTIKYVREDDPETQQLKSLLNAASNIFGTGRKACWTARDLAEKALERRELHDDRGNTIGNEPAHPALDDALADFITRGDVNMRRLGKWLAGVRKRIVDGLYLDAKEDKHIGMRVWWVEVAASI